MTSVATATRCSSVSLPGRGDRQVARAEGRLGCRGGGNAAPQRQRLHVAVAGSWNGLHRADTHAAHELSRRYSVYSRPFTDRYRGRSGHAPVRGSGPALDTNARYKFLLARGRPVSRWRSISTLMGYDGDHRVRGRSGEGGVAISSLADWRRCSTASRSTRCRCR